MTRCTISAFKARELPAVDVFMATHTSHHASAERQLFQLGRQFRFMATLTRGLSMGACQREPRRGMVKRHQTRPCLLGMTGFAWQPDLIMDVGMTIGA